MFLCKLYNEGAFSLSTYERVIVLSAYRGPSTVTNEFNHEQLRAKLDNLGYSCTEVRVSFKVAGKNIIELACLIPAFQPYDAQLLGQKFGQKVFLYFSRGEVRVMDTEVGRDLYTYGYYNTLSEAELKEAFTQYLQFKSDGQVIGLTLEEKRVPTRTESLLQLRDRAPLAKSEWVKVF